MNSSEVDQNCHQTRSRSSTTIKNGISQKKKRSRRNLSPAELQTYSTVKVGWLTAECRHSHRVELLPYNYNERKVRSLFRWKMNDKLIFFLSSSSSSFGEAPNMYVAKELHNILTQTSRALSLIGPPSQALWRSLMLAPSQSAPETRDVRWLSGQFSVGQLTLSQFFGWFTTLRLLHVCFWTPNFHIWFIWLSLAAAAALGPDWIIFEDRLCVHQWLWIRWDKSLSVWVCVCVWATHLKKKRNTCLFETKRQRFWVSGGNVASRDNVQHQTEEEEEE